MQTNENNSSRSLRKEDVFMEIAAFAYRDSIDRQIEEIENDPNARDFSPEAAERLHNRVMEQFTKRRRKQARKKAVRRILQIAACVMILCVVISYTAFHVDAARIAAANYMIKTFSQYSEVHYDAQMNALPPIGWVSPYYPTWLPEGTRVERLQIEHSNGHYIWYADKNGREFHFSVFSAANADAVYGYDTENTTQKELSINGQDAVLYYDMNRNIRTLIVPTADHFIMLQGLLSEDDIKKIAENIHLL